MYTIFSLTVVQLNMLKSLGSVSLLSTELLDLNPLLNIIFIIEVQNFYHIWICIPFLLIYMAKKKRYLI